MKKLRLPNINSIQISGRLTRDLELKYLNSGTPVVTLPLAFSRSYRDKQGQWQQESSFIDVIVWSASAEYCSQNLGKGDPVLVEGSLRTRMYVNKEGVNVKLTEIQASRVYPLEYESKDSALQEPCKSIEPTQASAFDDDESVPF